MKYLTVYSESLAGTSRVLSFQTQKKIIIRVFRFFYIPQDSVGIPFGGPVATGKIRFRRTPAGLEPSAITFREDPLEKTTNFNYYNVVT